MVWDYNLGCEVEIIKKSDKAPETIAVNGMLFNVKELPTAWQVRRIQPIARVSHIVKEEDGHWHCDCQWHTRLHKECNHIRAVKDFIKKWGEKDGYKI